MTFFLLSLRSALECVISGENSWSPGSALEVHNFSTKSEKCVGVRDLGNSWSLGSAWFLQLSLRSALGVRDFRKMLEVLGVRWKCVAHFCYSGGSALGVRESALECVTNDRSAWKVRTPTHFCSARGGLSTDPWCTPNYIPRIRRIGGCYGFTSKPPAARNGVNAITQKPRDGLFSNLVYTLVVIVSWPD